jgi:hypothetical protein
VTSPAANIPGQLVDWWLYIITISLASFVRRRMELKPLFDHEKLIFDTLFINEHQQQEQGEAEKHL